MRNELRHHGILGMRWGVRRYQNADGTYTAAGKARKNESYDANSGNDSEGSSDSSTTSTNHRASGKLTNYSTQELKDMTEHMMAEYNYKQAYSKLNPKQTSMGEKFVKALVEDTSKILRKSAVDAGSTLLTAYVKDLGFQKLNIDPKKYSNSNNEKKDEKK